MGRTRVKICCIATLKEAQMAIHSGADALGLVGRMPSGPGPIEDELIREIVSKLPSAVSTFLLTSETTFEGIAEHYARVWTNAIQIVDATTADVRKKLKKEFPWVKLAQVIHIEGPSSIEVARIDAETSDMLLLDSGRPSARIKVLGGTGRTHDWSLSAKIVKSVSIPVFLAGGLNSGNVKHAIKVVRPFGVDLCSGVRSMGVLDSQKLSAFMEQVDR